MRNVQRNLQPVFFKLYEGREEIYDEYGNKTGMYLPQYSTLKSAMLCVSPNKGNSEVEQFGSLTDYDRTMTTADPECPIDENSILWIDEDDTGGAYDYVVKLVSRWKNSTQYAIAKVEVSVYEEEQREIRAALERKAQIEVAKLHKENDNQS